MNLIGQPQPQQFISNAQQVGLSAFVNPKTLTAKPREEKRPQETSQLSAAAQRAIESEHHTAEKMLENARQAGASADEMDELTHDEGETSETNRRSQEWNSSRAAEGQPQARTVVSSNTEQLLKLLRENDDSEFKKLEERTPEEILEGVPEHARVAAARMVENQPVEKLNGLKPIPVEQSLELGSPELAPAEFTPVELEPHLLAESEHLWMEVPAEVLQLWEEQSAS